MNVLYNGKDMIGIDYLKPNKYRLNYGDFKEDVPYLSFKDFNKQIKQKQGYKKVKINLIELLGSGDFGMVWKIKIGKDVFSLKIINVVNEMFFISEIKALKVMGYFKSSNNTLKNIYIIFDFFDGKSMIDLDTTKYTQPQIKKISKSLIKQVIRLHSGGFMHRDIYKRNVLIDKNFNIRLIDFGLSVTSEDYYKEINFLVIGEHQIVSEKQVDSFFVNTDWYQVSLFIFDLLYKNEYGFVFELVLLKSKKYKKLLKYLSAPVEKIDESKILNMF